MSDNDVPSTPDRADESRPESAVSNAIASTEAYETDEGVVFYDADNPLAWMQSRETVRLDDAA
ncbi:DUF7331 family protein [Halocatena marina]|uniref:Uncharacterized protein n=1 Tax=Halocatena marina TaxID=2934937 RepID=A0ABD5YSJ0_9EURY|nr:hypothetical protein [Halocatena marina]